MRSFCPLFLLLLVGCARLSQPASSSQVPIDTEFNQLSSEYLAGYLAWRPQVGTSLGLHQYDGKVTDFSSRSIAAELVRLKSFDQRLAALATNHLSTPALHDYRILSGAVKREIFAFDSARIYSQNPMTYAGVLDVNIYIKRNFAPLPERVRSITAILNQAPQIAAAARANLAEALPQPLIETAIDQANGSADFLGKDLVDALKDVKDEQLMTEFRSVNSRAVQEMRNFATYLKEQKLPKANNAYALGREKYMRLLACSEMVTRTPEELLDLGMRELRRQQDSFTRAAREIDPAKPSTDVFRAIQKEHPVADKLIPDTANDLDRIRQFVIDHRIITIPSPVRAQVTETPQYLRATSFASMDTPGPFETKATEAYYYITPVEPDWTPQKKEEWLTAFDFYDISITSIHEAYPGHYVQFLCLNASPATKLEKIFTGYAFTEGWAHYCEEMMVDEGFGGSGPAATPEQRVTAAKYRMAQADEALLRVCRLCASIKLHCQGMTVDEATRFFQDNCYYEEKPARQEAIRGTFDPEYLYYTLGKLEILKLREDYRKQEGNHFTLEKFHNELLRHGAPPLRLLREVMLKDPRAWDQVL
jgi:uncharacterized protein (DUF885 family)